MVIVTRACDVQLHMICGGEAVVLSAARQALPLPCGCLCHVEPAELDDDLDLLTGGPR